MGPTPAQKDCIEHVSGPLLVSAGAGSGKTYMLTQRIAYARLHPELSGVDDINKVLAITFTELAASEIKARVRTKLREEKLAQDALKVDACWISTIHGMCSRILHENALALGIDPSFGLLDETDAEALLDEAIDTALREVATGRHTGFGRETPRDDETESPEESDAHDEPGETVADGYRDLFEMFERTGSSSNVGAMVKEIAKTVANVRGGMDAVQVRDALPPREIARSALDAIDECEAAAREGISKTGKQDGFATDALDAFMNPQTGRRRFEALVARSDLGYPDVAEALANLQCGFGARISAGPRAVAVARFRLAYRDLSNEAALGLVQKARGQLIALARRAVELFDLAKAEAGVLDQNDLLLKTLDAFENHPEVEAAYRDRFKLVMVDEFQDTSGLQIALIGHLTGGDRRLCTVGDTQQSIYRFRGADVDTYRAHKRHMRTLEGEAGGLCCELDRNFRSHGDIITFVNRVFSQDEVFGSSGEFIELGFDEGHAQANPFPPVARIDVVATVSKSSNSNAGIKGVKGDVRHTVEAEAIARRLVALHETGEKNCAWGDMVILLGKMTNADVYADALRAHGAPCIITGGSGFDKTAEATEVCALLQAVANPCDDIAMRAALEGAAFGLDGDELLRLASDEQGHKRGFWAGLCALGESDPSPRIRLAADSLGHAVDRAGSTRAAEILTELAVASGWLDRMQQRGVEGMALAANVLKAIRMVASIEEDPRHRRGIASTAERFAHKLEVGMKETPGALMSRSQDAVSIMTVHASKGLEFPIVALADFYGLRKSKGSLALETVGDTVYLSLAAPGSLVGKDARSPYGGLLGRVSLTDTMVGRLEENGIATAFGAGPDEAQTAFELAQAIKRRAEAEELGELRRKFYVGATRPREALIVAINSYLPSKKALAAGRPYGDVVDDLSRALLGPGGEFATAPEGIDFGGQTRARMELIRLECDPQTDEVMLAAQPGEEGPTYLGDYLPHADEPKAPGEKTGGCEAAKTAEAPLVPNTPGPGEHPFELVVQPRTCNLARAGVFSYSSIAAANGGEVDPGEGVHGPANEDELAWDGLATDAPGDAEAERNSEDAGWVLESSAVAFGSAFHAACQWMAERAIVDDGRLPAADEARLAALRRTWGLAQSDLDVLRDALDLWCASDVAREALAHPCIVPEAPFYVALQGTQGEPVHLEGSIDLLCWDPGKPAGEQGAFVVDYKTGGSASETPDELEAKHLLQAQCYAYAVLNDGYAAVELAFVRVQQHDAARLDQPQVVRYQFGRSDLQGLAEAVRAAYGRARK